MMRNKSGSISSTEKRMGHAELSTISTAPISKSSIMKNERKCSVGDLISLGTEQSVVFDPLLDSQRLQQNPHRILERTTNPSSGKHEHFLPPEACGSNQPQVRQFLARRSDQQAGQVINTTNPSVKSSDDLLSEYGLNFNSMSISSSSSKQPTQSHSAFSQPFFQNGNLSAPTIPPRTVNTSYLHNSSTPFLNQSTISTLPVNTSLSGLSSKQGSRQPPPNCRDILVDLDPLRFVQAAPGNHGHPVSGQRIVGGGPHHLKPPTLPPRTKKQWTTFD